MKNLVLCLMVLVSACETKKEKAAEPAPAPKPEPKPVEPPKPEPKPEACDVKVKIEADKITFDGGGVTGEEPFGAGKVPALDKLKPLAGKCTANVTAAPEVKYQEVIAVMDTLVKNGLPDVSLGDGVGNPPTDPVPGTVPPGTITGEWKDGVLIGKLDTTDRKGALQKAPVVIVTKTEVMFGGKTVAKIGAATLMADLAKALPPNPAEKVLILQADKDTSYATLSEVIKAAETSGYSNLLFAVKNR